MADFVQMFCNSSGFTINGGSFSNIGRDMNVYNINPEELQRLVGAITHQLQLYSRRNLPPAIGHTSANALVLNDALGETLTVPWSLVSSYEDLHDTLVKHFKHKLGEKHVVRRDYCIAQANGGTLVNAETWNEAMDTGEELTMIMLLDRIWLEEASKLCPKCGKTQIGTYEDDGWRICRRCNTRFRCVGKPSTEGNGDLSPEEDREEAAFRHVQGRFREVQQQQQHQQQQLQQQQQQHARLQQLQYAQLIQQQQQQQQLAAAVQQGKISQQQAQAMLMSKMSGVPGGGNPAAGQHPNAVQMQAAQQMAAAQQSGSGMQMGMTPLMIQQQLQQQQTAMAAHIAKLQQQQQQQQQQALFLKINGVGGGNPAAGQHPNAVQVRAAQQRAAALWAAPTGSGMQMGKSPTPQLQQQQPQPPQPTHQFTSWQPPAPINPTPAIQPQVYANVQAVTQVAVAAHRATTPAQHQLLPGQVPQQHQHQNQPHQQQPLQHQQQPQQLGTGQLTFAAGFNPAAVRANQAATAQVQALPLAIARAKASAYVSDPLPGGSMQQRAAQPSKRRREHIDKSSKTDSVVELELATHGQARRVIEVSSGSEEEAPPSKRRKRHKCKSGAGAVVEA